MSLKDIVDTLFDVLWGIAGVLWQAIQTLYDTDLVVIGACVLILVAVAGGSLLISRVPLSQLEL